MTVFVAGATGAIGKWLVPLLIESGHQVIGTTSKREHLAAVSALDAEGCSSPRAMQAGRIGVKAIASRAKTIRSIRTRRHR